MEYPRNSFIRLIMTKRKLQASPKFRFFADVAVQDQKRRKKYVAVEDEKSDARSVTTKDFRTGATVISRVSMRTIWETSRHLLLNNLESDEAQKIDINNLSRHGNGYKTWQEALSENINFMRKLRFEDSQCIVTTLNAAKFDGSTLRTTKGLLGIKNTNVLVYQLLLTVFRGYPPSGCVASHLCHNAQCINPHHLVWENQSLNVLRNTCAKMVEARLRSKVSTRQLCIHEPVCSGCEADPDAASVRDGLSSSQATNSVTQ